MAIRSLHRLVNPYYVHHGVSHRIAMPCASRLMSSSSSSSAIVSSEMTSNEWNTDGPLAGYTRDNMSNISDTVLDRLNRNLHRKKNHPISIIKQRITSHLNDAMIHNGSHCEKFTLVDDISPIVTTQQNFDSLVVPKDHSCRSARDTYYVNEDILLRTHTSAHQADLIKQGLRSFLVAGDVYRRDEIDSSHFPVFHQMEGVRLFSTKEAYDELRIIDPRQVLFNALLSNEPIDASSPNTSQLVHRQSVAHAVERNLKLTLESLARYLFGEETQTRWVNAYFPFTQPSWEMEVNFHGEWLEILGCGVIRQEIIDDATGKPQEAIGWAFGLGLERLAMVLYQIPDIRLFWSEDPRFISQFNASATVLPRFRPFSKHPPCSKDVAFWLPSSNKDSEDSCSSFQENTFFEVIRSVAGDLVESVKLVDEFTHPGTGCESKCYRVIYRSMDRSVTNEETNNVHENVREALQRDMNIQLRVR